MLGFQAADFGVGDIGNDGRTAGAVGADDDGFGFIVGIGRFHAFAQHFHLVFVRIAADLAFKADNGGVLAAGGGKGGVFAVLAFAEYQRQHQ